MLSFFPRGVLDEILNLIESVSDGFPFLLFQCRGILLIWIIVRRGPIVLAVGADGGCLDIFSLIYHFSFLSPSLWETARYRLKYCFKGPLSPKQPTNQIHDCTVKTLHSLTYTESSRRHKNVIYCQRRQRLDSRTLKQ